MKQFFVTERTPMNETRKQHILATLEHVESILPSEPDIELSLDFGQSRNYSAMWRVRLKHRTLVTRSDSESFFAAVNQSRDHIVRQIRERKREKVTSRKSSEWAERDAHAARSTLTPQGPSTSAPLEAIKTAVLAAVALGLGALPAAFAASERAPSAEQRAEMSSNYGRIASCLDAERPLEDCLGDLGARFTEGEYCVALDRFMKDRKLGENPAPAEERRASSRNLGF